LFLSCSSNFPYFFTKSRSFLVLREYWTHQWPTLSYRIYIKNIKKSNNAPLFSFSFVSFLFFCFFLIFYQVLVVPSRVNPHEGALGRTHCVCKDSWRICKEKENLCFVAFVVFCKFISSTFLCFSSFFCCLFFVF
jgi:hypothetical protein